MTAIAEKTNTPIIHDLPKNKSSDLPLDRKNPTHDHDEHHHHGHHNHSHHNHLHHEHHHQIPHNTVNNSNAKATDQAKDKPQTEIKKTDEISKINSAEPKQNQDPNQKPKKIKPKDLIKPETSLGRFLLNDFVANSLPIALNATSLIFNVFSAVGEALTEDKKIRKITDTLGEIGYRAFLMTNGTINFLEQLYFKNYLSAIANLFDNLIAVKVKKEHGYLTRGFIVGCYTIANSLSILNNKYQFSGIDEHVQHLKDGLVKSWKLFIEDPVKSLVSSETGILGTFSGLLMIIGSSIWSLFKSESVASSIRDLGGILIDIERLKPEHYKRKRKYYFFSGAGYTVGTIADYLSKMVPSKRNFFVSLNIIADSLARMFQRESQRRGELEHKPIDNQENANKKEAVQQTQAQNA